MPTVVEKPKNPNEVSFKQRERDLKEQDKQEQEQLKRLRKSPFSRFYQVNKDNSEFLRSCLNQNPKSLELLFFIFDHMDKYNAVMCSYQVFQEHLGMSSRTVSRCIKYLKDNGFLYVYKSGSSNVYIANSDLVWNSWGNNVEYCEFPANIILSKTEQTEKSQTKKVRDKKVTTVKTVEENA